MADTPAARPEQPNNLIEGIQNGFADGAGQGMECVPAPGGEAAPFLDKGGRNVPNTTRPPWSKKQWLTRRVVLDRLQYWQANRYQCLWITLTSSPDSPDQRLRRDFQTLRKRIKRELGFAAFQYVCVDTREGHGVLHMIWAWRDPNSQKRSSFYIPFEWLQTQWQDIHGAFHVNVKRIGNSAKDSRRLSRYIVAQYCGDQYGLVRVSQSRQDIPLTKMRKKLLATIRGLPERYKLASQLPQTLSGEELSSVMNQWLMMTFRQAWDDLVTKKHCEAFGVRLVWWGDTLERM